MVPNCFCSVISVRLYQLLIRLGESFWIVCGSVWTSSPPRFLLTSIFDESKKIVLKWKIVQSYKTSWNSSKFIDIYNIIIPLDTRDGILSVMIKDVLDRL